MSRRTFKPVITGLKIKAAQAPDLKKLLSLGTQELYVVRTRDIGPQKKTDPWNNFDEGVPNNEIPIDQIPIDQLDFKQIFYPFFDPNDPPPSEHRFHYARANNPNGAAWHCVYPYPDGNPVDVLDYRTKNPAPPAGSGIYAYAGWKQDPRNINDPTKKDLKPVYFGVPKGVYGGGQWGDKPTATYFTRQLQIANRDTAGPTTRATSAPASSRSGSSSATATSCRRHSPAPTPSAPPAPARRAVPGDEQHRRGQPDGRGQHR